MLSFARPSRQSRGGRCSLLGLRIPLLVGEEVRDPSFLDQHAQGVVHLFGGAEDAVAEDAVDVFVKRCGAFDPRDVVTPAYGLASVEVLRFVVDVVRVVVHRYSSRGCGARPSAMSCFSAALSNSEDQ